MCMNGKHKRSTGPTGQGSRYTTTSWSFGLTVHTITKAKLLKTTESALHLTHRLYLRQEFEIFCCRNL